MALHFRFHLSLALMSSQMCVYFFSFLCQDFIPFLFCNGRYFCILFSSCHDFVNDTTFAFAGVLFDDQMFIVILITKNKINKHFCLFLPITYDTQCQLWKTRERRLFLFLCPIEKRQENIVIMKNAVG